MRTTLSIFIICVLSPIIAGATCQLNTDGDACVSYNGCYLTTDTSNNTICSECAIGYYNNGNSNTTTSCVQCPYGMTTTTTASTAQSQCYMDSSTNFCDANGANCMHLIPTGTTISAQ